MWEAVQAEEDSIQQKKLVQVYKEYQSLKQLVHISQSFGNNCLFNDHKHSELFITPTNCFENEQNQSFIKLE